MDLEQKRDDELKELMASCFGSTKVSAKVMFPKRFHLSFPDISNEIFRILDDDSIRQAVIAAPRGWGKTSIVNLAYPAKKIMFREKKFIVPISNTATQAVMQSENLKRELLTNRTIKELFGNMKSDHFTKDSWVTQNGVMVLPRGAGQQVRGILYGDYRPDLIIGDDLEDAEAVRSEEQRQKMKEWFFADVCNSINRGRKDWKIVVIGTILHEDSLLMNLLEDPDWYSVTISLCDDDYNSNWPDYISSEEVRKLAKGYAERGLLDVFYREYRNIPISTEDATFQQSYFRYYDEAASKLSSDPNVFNFVLIDPAKTVKLHSAESAVVGVGVDRTTNKIYVRDLVAKKLYPDQLYDEAFSMCQRLNAQVLAVEVTSLNEFITFPIKNEMVKRKLFNLEYVELKARGKKEDRIASLVPLYRTGAIHHNRMVCGPLEAQLMSFPRSRRFDAMDALAYVVELLEQGEVYFSGKDDPPEPEDDFVDYDPRQRYGGDRIGNEYRVI